MTNKQLSITIGIPAFNEESNIAALLRSLISQNENHSIVKRIIVYSDASTDKTQQKVESVKSEVIQFIQSKHRMGKPAISNYFFKNAVTDCVVILDADIRIDAKSFIDELVIPIALGQADLTAAKVLELEPITFTEKVLFASMQVKRTAFEKFQNGNNIYTCHGRARAFSKKFYQKFTSISEVTADDSYSYIACNQLGFVYRYAPKAVLKYRLPQNIEDHIRQSSRFIQGKQQLLQHFSESVVAESFALPANLTFHSLLSFMKSYPIYFLCYIFILCYSKLQTLLTPSASSQWSIATSSKALN